MSHETGQVRFQDGTIRFFEYNGTVDIPMPKLWETEDEVQDHWREERAFDRKCNCGHPPEDVEACTDYGTGLYWKAQACKPCGVIFDNSDPYEKYGKHKIYGIPQWVKHTDRAIEHRLERIAAAKPGIHGNTFEVADKLNRHLLIISKAAAVMKPIECSRCGDQPVHCWTQYKGHFVECPTCKMKSGFSPDMMGAVDIWDRMQLAFLRNLTQSAAEKGETL
jgi:hypothetical protein